MTDFTLESGGLPPLTFTVIGVPQSQGSTKSFGFIRKDPATGMPRVNRLGRPMISTVTTNDNAKNRSWRELVGTAAAEAIRSTPGFRVFDGAVALGIVFYLPRPKAIGRKEPPHTKKPDLGKLIRSVEDALTNVVWGDDKQVTDYDGCRKRYAAPGEPPRAVVTVRPI